MLLRRNDSTARLRQRNTIAIVRRDLPTTVDEKGNVVFPVFLIPVVKELVCKLIGFLAITAAGIALYKPVYKGLSAIGVIGDEDEEAAAYDAYMRAIYSSEFADSVANRVYIKMEAFEKQKMSTEEMNQLMSNAAYYDLCRRAEQAMQRSIATADQVAVPSSIVAAISDPADSDTDAAHRLLSLSASCAAADPELAALMRDLGGLLLKEGAARFLTRTIVADVTPTLGGALTFGELYNEFINAVMQIDPVRVRYLAVAQALTHSNM